jgi:hypothetical protein
MNKASKIAAQAAVGLGLVALTPTSFAAPIVFSGYDVGASSLATGPNSVAASTAFDSATGPLTVIDFDTNNIGATLSPASSPQSCGFALCGGNTTPGGSGFYGAVFTTTITFDSPIDSFGAYFSGWQRDDQLIAYTSGGPVTLNMPAGDVSAGGLVFFGFIDAGASITSLEYSTSLGDFVAIDDMRFGRVGTATVPEPGTLALLGLSLVGFVASRRLKQ